jgi:hypothetical protein
MDAVINGMRLGLVEMDLGTYLIIYLTSYVILFINCLIIYDLGLHHCCTAFKQGLDT